MSKDIVKHDIKALLDAWMLAEAEGVEFPVQFDVAWRIVGYARKDSAKRKLPKRLEGKAFHKDVDPKTNREDISLTLDCFKRLCLMADTEIGDAVRQYMIERDKTLTIVEQIAPEVYSEAQRIKDEKEAQRLRLQIELKQAETQAAIAQSNLIDKRDAILRICPDAHAKAALGYQVIEKIEYRDRIYHDEDLLNDGSTITKTELSRRYGLTTKKLAPFIKQLPPEAFDDSVYVRRCEQVKREWVSELDDIVNRSTRQKWLGE